MNKTYELHLGDCLEQMAQIADESVDVIVADSPYVLNIKSSMSSKRYRLNAWGDMVNPAYWYAGWIQECKRVLKPDGCLWTFMNWRSLVTFQKAACDIDWPIASLLVWDKQWPGLGSMKGLRQSYEMVALFLKGAYSIPNRSLTDVWQFPWSSKKPHGHPAEKPQGLIELILKESPGDVVMDPFMGSGTTGAAAVKLGKYFIGFELDPNFYQVARERLKAVEQEKANAAKYEKDLHLSRMHAAHRGWAMFRASTSAVSGLSA